MKKFEHSIRELNSTGRKLQKKDNATAGTNIYRTERWKRVSKQVKTLQPTCMECKKNPSTISDHIRELSEGGEPFDLFNLQGLCRSCHEAKTLQVQQGVYDFEKALEHSAGVTVEGIGGFTC